MIDIILFRERIGSFNRLFKAVFSSMTKLRHSYVNIMKMMNFNLWKFLTKLIVISTIWMLCEILATNVDNF